MTQLRTMTLYVCMTMQVTNKYRNKNKQKVLYLQFYIFNLIFSTT